ncbi:MAG TPA: PH domain-containing protein [Mycobacteriales bacterium]|nr:PH domain-containing protein [Mycobacteriales bacterium]
MSELVEGTPPAALPSEWARLNPLSPVVRAGSAVVGVLGIFAINGAAQHRPSWPDAVIVGLAAVTGVVYWWVTRWRVHGGELQIDTGLLRRQQVRVPLTRIQGIDLVRPLLARILGVSELRLVLAGHDGGRARLAYLNEDRAIAVRAQLLALAHGLADDTPEPPEQPILVVPGSRIVASNLLTLRFGIGLLMVIALIGFAVGFPQAAGPLLGSAVPIVIGDLLVTWRLVSSEWEFHLAEAPDGIRLRSGLLQTRAETIPHGRIQAVRWVEPLLWRPFGWVRLEFDVARRRNAQRGQRESALATRALLPAGTREQARWLVGRLLPGAVAELPRTEGPPRRAFWRAPLARRYARIHVDERYVACCTGRIRPDTVVVPLEKVQSIRWTQGPWARRLHLANVFLDTAGQRFTATARHRDRRQAQELIDSLPDLARSARARVSAR